MYIYIDTYICVCCYGFQLVNQFNQVIPCPNMFYESYIQAMVTFVTHSHITTSQIGKNGKGYNKTLFFFF